MDPLSKIDAPFLDYIPYDLFVPDEAPPGTSSHVQHRPMPQRIHVLARETFALLGEEEWETEGANKENEGSSTSPPLEVKSPSPILFAREENASTLSLTPCPPPISPQSAARLIWKKYDRDEFLFRQQKRFSQQKRRAPSPLAVQVPILCCEGSMSATLTLKSS